MESNKFAAILPIIVGGLINMIVSERAISEDEALEKLYSSALYSHLEDEKSKVWHL
jgi:hypothetical protein